MANICCVSKVQLKSPELSGKFSLYNGQLSREDVATIVEVFEYALGEVNVKNIVGVLKSSDGYFAFLVEPNTDNGFDFYKYLNNGYKGSLVISPINAKRVFSRALSRGIYSQFEDEEDYREENEVYDDDEEETPTGYVDGGPELSKDVVVYLRCIRTGDMIKATEDGVIIGRSSKSAEYVIRGNDNISRPHCKLLVKGGTAYIEDLGSKNGTTIRGKKYGKDDGKVKVVNGESVILGDEKCVIVVK